MMKKTICTACCLLWAAMMVAAPIDVKDFGAKGDGTTLDNHAINAAIEACAERGGGTVNLPAGTYLSGSIHLKSNVELHLDAGATILATDKAGAYDPSETFGFPGYQDGGNTYSHH